MEKFKQVPCLGGLELLKTPCGKIGGIRPPVNPRVDRGTGELSARRFMRVDKGSVFWIKDTDALVDRGIPPDLSSMGTMQTISLSREARSARQTPLF